jgi:alpha-glucosidase
MPMYRYYLSPISLSSPSKNAGIKKRAFLSLCAAFLLAGPLAFAQTTALPPQAQLTALPNGVELTDGSARIDVRILEDRVASVHVLTGGQATPRTSVISPQPALRAPASIARSEQKGVYTLTATGIAVRIQEAAPYSIAFFDATGRQLLRSEDPFGEARDSSIAMQRADSETLYGIHGLALNERFGELARDAGGRAAAGAQGNSGAPFVFTANYGLLVDSNGGEFATDLGRIDFRHGSRPDVEYFVMAGSPLETMASLSRLVGPPPMPPKWTLGFFNSQWGSTQDEVEKIVATYRAKHLPFDSFILDFDWKAWGEDDYGEWRWNSTSGTGSVAPNKFPDGASGEFARRMTAEGVKLVGILKPRILVSSAEGENKPTAAAAYATEHGFWHDGEKPSSDYFSTRLANNIDFSKPEARAWYWQHLLPAFRTGMVAWWSDEADEDSDEQFNNFQFLNMGRALYDGQRADSNLRVWSINRNFYLGSSRYGYAGWSGDISTGFASMAFQRRRMLAALNTGEFHWSMDTGGFGGHPTPENYARWMEFAAFVPIMRVHGDLNEKRQPWVYGPVAEDAARHALELRYQLLPYIYSYERLNTEGEAGLVRPLFWQFPADREAATLESEWMFGDALLVSPVAAQGATSQAVYLPAGKWFDYATGHSYAGAQRIQLPVDAKSWKDIPLFVRAGSILATQPVEEYVGQHPVAEIALDIFPADSAAAFTVYDDDGQSYDYEKGIYLRQRVAAQRDGKKIQVAIDAASGSYSGALHTYLLRIHAAARKVTIDGKPLPMAAAANSSSSDAVGTWTQTSDRFGPVVLVRVVAGAKTSSTVVLQ